VRYDSEKIGLLVDEIKEIITLNTEEITILGLFSRG
jgi:chemotaxis signal transduction protein